MSEKDKNVDGDIAVIGKSIFIDGTIRGDQDLVIYGEVEGAINMADAKVLVAKSGNVVANILAREIEVQGTVQGELRATESVDIQESGRLTGNIRAPRVILSDGCQFKGSVDMEHKVDQSADRARIPLPAGAEVSKSSNAKETAKDGKPAQPAPPKPLSSPFGRLKGKPGLMK